MNYQQSFGQNLQPIICNTCGLARCGPASIWNALGEPCKCTPGERKQLTEADVRRIIREELATFFPKT